MLLNRPNTSNKVVKFNNKMMDSDATSLSQLDCPYKLELVNIIDSCRICMAQTLNMSSIFDTEKENFVEEIHFCTGITIKEEAGLPNQICELCRKNLSVAYKFKTTCLISDETFRKLVTPLIKDEVTETDLNNLDYDGIEFKDEGLEESESVKKESESEQVKTENEVLETKDNVVKKSSLIKVKAGKVKSTPGIRGSPKKPAGAPKEPKRMKKFKFKRLWCEPCNMKFDTKEQSDDHKKEAHKDVWVCEICGKLFIHRGSHYTHVRSHQPPKYGCDQCDYKTWHKSDLVKHVRIHGGVKLYQCEYCSSSHHTSSNLTSHIRRQHMNERLYNCNICRRTFFEKTKLNRHIDSHFEIKRFECDICHACFSRRCYWKKHLLRQHDIVTPPQRPGRQKINVVIGEYLEKPSIGDFYQKDSKKL